jgi:hypothetical protein
MFCPMIDYACCLVAGVQFECVITSTRLVDALPTHVGFDLNEITFTVCRFSSAPLTAYRRSHR